MGKGTGIVLDSNGDLLITPTRKSGLIVSGIAIGNTVLQNQKVLLKSQKGEIREYPLLGVGIEDMCDDDDMEYWLRNIRIELAKDGLKCSSVSFIDGMLLIKADYK